MVYLNDGELVECTSVGYKIHDTVRCAKKAKKLLVPSGDNPAVTASMVLGEAQKPRLSPDDGEPGSPSGPEASLDGLENPVVKLEMQLDEIEKGGRRLGIWEFRDLEMQMKLRREGAEIVFGNIWNDSRKDLEIWKCR